MGKIIQMTRRRRTYKNHGGEAEHGDAPANPVGDPGFPTPAPQRSNWLKVMLTVAGSAVLGAVAVDFYRKMKGPTRNPEADDDGGAAGTAPIAAAVPGAPSVMPMPMPMPVPMPMPMPNYGGFGYGGAPPAPPAPEPMTAKERIELAKLEVEATRNKEALERLRMWEDGELD